VKDLTEGVKEAARKAGADLIGIADIDRFEGLPAQHNPLSILPEARSVIVLGKRAVRGTLRGVEEGTQFSNYRSFIHNWLDQFLAIATFETCAYIEDHRWEAVPLLNLPKETPTMGIAVRDGQPKPNVTVNCDEAAVRAGLGEIGYCGLVLTPEFGPRQQFQVILTAAELEPDPILEEPVCDMCLECARTCPLGAMSTTETTEISVCGKTMTVARIDYSKCAICQNGAQPNKYHEAAPPDRLAAICMRSCVDHLGKEGRVKDVPRLPFRRRDPWARVPFTLTMPAKEGTK